MADAAICVNPKDERHFWLKGKKVLIPLINREIPVIEDDYVEMDFGTGCLKVTPAHDVHDYEIGLRHNLPVLEIIDDHGRLNEKAQILVGEDRFVARKKIVKMLEEAGNLLKVEDYTSPVGYSERTNAVIEPKLSAQWFLKMDTLARVALETVESGKTKFIPDKYMNTYRHWMENARDWCISRQLWWGQRIPAWYLPDGSFVVDTPPYHDRLMELRDKYRDRIEILFGVEAGLQPVDHIREYFREYIPHWGFDFVIGSSHVVRGKDPYYPEFFDDLEIVTRNV
jgi:valyl-tRNA synthetase